MTDAQRRRLESLRHHHTLYEVALISPEGAKHLLCYTERSGRRLRAAVVKRAARVLATIADDGAVVTAVTKESLTLTGGWVVRFTGRTERESIINGALPYIGS
jgi:hypothetical protein